MPISDKHLALYGQTKARGEKVQGTVVEGLDLTYLSTMGIKLAIFSFIWTSIHISSRASVDTYQFVVRAPSSCTIPVIQSWIIGTEE